MPQSCLISLPFFWSNLWSLAPVQHSFGSGCHTCFFTIGNFRGSLPEGRASPALVEARCLPHPGLSPPILLATSANPASCSRAGLTAMLQSQFRSPWDLWHSTVQISQELYPGAKLSSKPLILCSCTLVLWHTHTPVKKDLCWTEKGHSGGKLMFLQGELSSSLG